MEVSVDLHTHTTCSDGMLSPEALVQKVSESGLSVLAITDHDTIAAIPDGRLAAEKYNVTLVSGVELSIRFDARELHLLGYFFDTTHTGFLEFIGYYSTARKRRARLIVEKLDKLGISLDYDAIEAQVGDVIGRPHIARALIDGGHVDNYEAAFGRYLRNGGPADVEKELPRLTDALSVLHDAGGIGILAHPGNWVTDREVRRMVDYGLDGLEIIHPSHDDYLYRYYKKLGEDLGILMTGGSDFHGMRPGDETALGAFGLSQTQFEALHS